MENKELAKVKMKILTLILMSLMVIAIAPSLANAQTTNWEATPLYHIRTPDASPAAIAGYSPGFIIGAYNLQSTNGGLGTTIAIVDAYNDPNVASNLVTFSAQFSLPTANLIIHKMSSSIQSNSNWAVEISLDVEWAHAIAPQATILLVEATTNSMANLMSAVSYATSSSTPGALGIPQVVALSMSWGGSEFSGETTYDNYFASQSITFFASSGDTGGAVIWPSSSVNVISVGGTTLTQGTSGYTETAWSGSGGGVSAYESKPAYQSGLVYSNRATPDVSYNADPNTGYAIYDNYGYSGWLVVGGTSCGAPQWAAIQALSKSVSSAALYTIYTSSAYTADFRDVTVGTSGSYSAGTGYDLCTGIGSPLTDFAAPTQPDFTISANPPSLTISSSSQGTSTITIGSVGGFSDPVQLTATGISGVSVTASPVPGFGTATLTVPAGTTVGSYQVVVTGTDTINSAITHSVTINVQVNSPDYSLSASSKSLSVQTGRSGTDRITISPLNSYTGKVILSASGAPTGVTCSFSTNPVSITSSAVASTLTINVPRGTHTGTYTITIQGTDGTLTHAIQITLTIPR